MGYLELGILAIPKIETISTYDINEIGDGFHQYDDMILDDLQERLFRNVDSELERNAIKGEKYRWPGGVIPYKVDESTVDESMKNDLRDYAEIFSKQMEGCLTIR